MQSGDDRAPAASRRWAARAIAGGALAAPLILAACGSGKSEPDADATQMLMLQHGLLRRLLALYRRSVLTLRINPAVLDAKALAEATALFRSYGEDYHERALEEALVFPRLEKAGGATAALVGVMRQQHERGRALIDFVQAQCAGGAVGAAQAEPAARALESMADMYEAHAAFEDTAIYPAWRKLLTAPERREAAERFASLQQNRFKANGFDAVQAEVAMLERRLGAPNAGVYTAPLPSTDSSDSSSQAADAPD